MRSLCRGSLRPRLAERRSSLRQKPLISFRTSTAPESKYRGLLKGSHGAGRTVVRSYAKPASTLWLLSTPRALPAPKTSDPTKSASSLLPSCAASATPSSPIVSCAAAAKLVRGTRGPVAEHEDRRLHGRALARSGRRRPMGADRAERGECFLHYRHLLSGLHQ